jgi:hypothetical protein
LGTSAAGFACKTSVNFVGRSKLRENHVRWEASRLFVRCATEDCSCTLVDIDVLEEGCDLWREVVERGCGERFQLLGTEISIDASRSRAEPVPSLLFEVRLQLRNDGTSLCPKEKFMCRVSTKSQCEKDEEQ